MQIIEELSTVSVGAAQSFIAGEFGGPTEEVGAEVTVSSSTLPERITLNDPDALALTIINVGTDTAYLYFDDTVSTSKGVILQPGGGSLNVTVRDDQTLPTRSWHAVSASSTVLSYIRTRRYALTY